MSTTPTTSTFVGEISSLVAQKDAHRLAQFLIIEPPYPASYQAIIQELRRAHPKAATASSASSFSFSSAAAAAAAAAASDDALEVKVGAQLTSIRDGDGSSWNAFVKFMVVYLAFLRDVDVENLLETYNLLSDLLQKANSALGNQTHGIIILPTVVQYSRVLSRLAIGLDRKPHLIAHLVPKSGGDDGGPRETLPERAANILRQAFVTCLNDRSGNGGLDKSGNPEGKKRGIYTIANLCLKILFACHKIRGCAQIFDNIYVQSPPLTAYPKSERVTYLYYLGRFLWANGHAYRAQKVLQAAWNECHSKAVSQGRLILIFLISSNMVCGRFPSEHVLARPEAHGLRERFSPLCRYIAQGDLCSFRRHLDVGSPHYAWFSQHRLDLQIRNRCEVFVWRSLVRKAYLLNGDPGEALTKKAPTVDLNDVLALFHWQERKYLTPPGQTRPQVYIDPDFIGMEGLLDHTGEDEALVLPDMTAILSKMSALVHQDFLNGFLSFSRQKFAIQGARTKGGLVAGFPKIWDAVEKRSSDDEVPGWKVEGKRAGGSGIGPGMVVHMSGARPVGASAFG